MKVYDTIVIGGGQAGLSMGYFLRRQKLDYLILDDREEPGGAWLNTWDSLKLFSPGQFSSLSGWMMPKGTEEYPGKDEFLDYLRAYEQRYNFPIERPVTVKNVMKKEGLFILETDRGIYQCKTLVSATGTANGPYVPDYPGSELFSGTQLHSIDYRSPDDFVDKRTLIIGGGNSGAQILAELSKVTHTQWVTLKPPHFLPEEIDGRYLFESATARFLDLCDSKKKHSLGDIVMVETVKEAKARGVLESRAPFESFDENGVVWADGNHEAFDAVIWCTGFKAQFDYLAALNLMEDNRIATEHTRSIKEPKLWLVGYGSWTGYASATVYGVGKTARQTAVEIAQALRAD